MSYSAAIDYLFGLQKHGIKLGLDKTAKILGLTGNPQTEFRCIHIAGTNGKGSVSAMTASILSACGFRVGLFTSPHLVSFTERIRVGDTEITEDEVSALTDEIRSMIAVVEEELSPTFFEVVTAMAFRYFAQRKVDWAVIETGMGGRLDATNLVAPEVAVITRISCDHREFLGEGIPQIAGEKAGIIKEGVPVVSASQVPEAAEVIAAAAQAKSAQVFFCGDHFTGSTLSTGIGGTRFDYTDGAVRMENLFTPLAGEYQALNAALAIKAVSTALERAESNDNAGTGLCACPHSKSTLTEAIRTGLETTRWRGRLELVSSDPPIIVDGAHNADAAAALAGFISRHLTGNRIILVLGIMADKDVGEIVNTLLAVADETIFTAPAYSRAESPAGLAAVARDSGFGNIHECSTVKAALVLAKERQAVMSGNRPAVIVITGSFYTAGEALQELGERSVLSTLREAR